MDTLVSSAGKGAGSRRISVLRSIAAHLQDELCGFRGQGDPRQASDAFDDVSE